MSLPQEAKETPADSNRLAGGNPFIHRYVKPASGSIMPAGNLILQPALIHKMNHLHVVGLLGIGFQRPGKLFELNRPELCVNIVFVGWEAVYSCGWHGSGNAYDLACSVLEWGRKP